MIEPEPDEAIFETPQLVRIFAQVRFNDCHRFDETIPATIVT